MFGTFAQAARDNKPATYQKPHHDTMFGFWNPQRAKAQRRRPRPCEVEMILAQAQHALEKGDVNKAAQLLSRI